MKFVSLLFLTLMMFLAGCGGTSDGTPENTPTRAAPLSAAVGTLNYSDRVGTSFMFVFNLDDAPP